MARTPGNKQATRVQQLLIEADLLGLIALGAPSNE
jgi:hypothetical protein